MGKIIKIEDDKILIGIDNGSIEEVRISDMNFSPIVGDEVEIFKNEKEIIVTKTTKTGSGTASNHDKEGVNININNQVGTPDYYGYPSGKVVNKTIYCLLAFFLGGIGVHKFYSGKIGSGILYIIFFWTFIPAFIAFIEFLVALFKRSDVNGNIVV